MTYTFNLQMTVDKEFQPFADILITGVEGGINYWADVLAYKHECQPSETFAKVREIEEDDGNNHTITTDTIARAIEVMLSTPDVFYSSTGDSARNLAIAILTEADDLDYDAGDADCMIQIGLFGDVIYG